jgi:hypothetical protein
MGAEFRAEYYDDVTHMRSPRHGAKANQIEIEHARDHATGTK